MHTRVNGELAGAVQRLKNGQHSLINCEQP